MIVHNLYLKKKKRRNELILHQILHDGCAWFAFYNLIVFTIPIAFNEDPKRGASSATSKEDMSFLGKGIKSYC